MLPSYCGLYNIDLLVNQSHLHPGISGVNYLEGTHTQREQVRPLPVTRHIYACSNSHNKNVYLLQLLNERVQRNVRLRRPRHVHVQLITVGQCIQTQNKCHIFMKQAGLCRGNVWL